MREHIRLLEVKPIDSYVIGGLRNFQAGSDTYRETLPLPDIIKFFSLVDLNVFKVCGVFLKKENTIYFPVPADFLRPRKGESGNLKLSTLVELESLIHEEGNVVLDIETEYLPYLREEADDKTKYEGASGFIALNHLESYFRNGTIEGLKTEDLKPISAFVKQELKIGLTLDFDNFTAEESRLYMTFLNRLERDVKLVALLVEKQEAKHPEGLYYFGGETRVAQVKTQKEEPSLSFLQEEIPIEKGKLYRLYLTSHTYLPEELNIGRTLKVGGCEFSLVWVFSAGKEWISGFAKPAIKMLKPGTVLVLKALKECKNLKRLTYIESKALLPVLKNKNLPKDINNFKEEELHHCGWNHGILGPYKGG